MKPQGIKQAELALWVSIAAFAGTTLINKWMGTISAEMFAWTLVIYSIMCMFPYKIGRRSNATRYVYAVMMVGSLLLMVGGASEMAKLDWVMSILQLPLEGFILFRLFERDASEWFTGIPEDAY